MRTRRSRAKNESRKISGSARTTPYGERSLAKAYAIGALSARGRHRVLRVARTIADLDEHEHVTHADVLTALSLRQRGVAETALAA